MFDFFVTALLSLLAVFPTFGSQGIQQLQQWRATEGRVELASSTASFRIPSLASLDCIGTDGDGDFQAGTCTGGVGGSGFSTTSADYWKSVRNFFSTTSASHFSALGLAFSTTSADYWETQQPPRGGTHAEPFPSNATTTLLDFTAGLSIASHTVSTSTVVCKQAAGCEYTTIQSAIDAGHTNILVRNGVYSEQINLSAAKTQIIGESLNAIIQCNGATQSPCVTADTDEFALKGFTIRETNAALVGTGIDFSNAALGLIEGVRVNNFSTSTKATDTVSNTFYNKLIGNTFFNPRSCIDLGGSQPNANSSAWNRCRPMAVNGAIGFYLADVRGFTSIADDVEATTTGVTSIGIYVGTTSREISFTNPWVEANGTGINIASGANRTTFTGGSITSNGTDITDNGTNTIFINTSDTGVLVNRYGNATTTSLGILNLTDADCDVKSNTDGSLFCGTDATGAGGGSEPFPSLATSSLLTFTNGLISGASTTLNNFTAFNATTTHATSTTFAVTGLTASRAIFTNAISGLTTTGTVGAIEAAVGSQNILLETEVDGCSELAALLDGETGGCNGSSGPVLPDGPTFSGLATFARSTTSLASFDYASSTLYFGAGLADCHTGNMLTWLSGRFGCEADDEGAGGGGAEPFPSLATTSLLTFSNGLIAGASTTLNNFTGLNATTTLLQFPSGGVMGWNNGDLLLTHTSNLLTLSGGAFAVGNGTITSVAGGIIIAGSGGGAFNVTDQVYTGAIDVAGLLTSSSGVNLGGSTFLEIPNGTNPTANDVGEIAHDTTDNQLILDDLVIATGVQKIWSTTVASTSPIFIAGSTLSVPTELDGYTITAIRCKVDGGTSKVIAVEDASGNSSEDITCATTVTSDDGSITNAAYTAAEEAYIDFGATTGVVDTVSISVFGTWTRE